MQVLDIMSADGLVEAVFYIPTRRDSSGEQHTSSAILELERFLEEEFGGFTVHGVVRGAWRNPETGEIKHDDSFHYSVALLEGDVKKLRSFLGGRARTLFDQKAIYFKIGGEVEFL